MFSTHKAPVVVGQLRDGGRRQPSQELSLQPLPAALSGAQIGSGERRFLRQTDPLGVHGAEDSPPGNQVGMNLHFKKKKSSYNFSRCKSFFWDLRKQPAMMLWGKKIAVLRHRSNFHVSWGKAAFSPWISGVRGLTIQLISDTLQVSGDSVLSSYTVEFGLSPFPKKSESILLEPKLLLFPCLKKTK